MTDRLLSKEESDLADWKRFLAGNAHREDAKSTSETKSTADATKIGSQFSNTIESLCRNSIDPLSRSIQREMTKRAQAGDEEARERVVRSQFRWVIKLARDLESRSQRPIEDVVQDGLRGLLIAIDKFDHEKGSKPSTYATSWIRQRIFQGIQHKDKLIRIPYHTQNEIKAVYNLEERYRSEHGELPTDQYISDELDIEQDRVNKLRFIYRVSSVSLDDSISDDEGSNFLDLLANSGAPDPERQASLQALQEDMREVMRSELTQRQCGILELRYGLDNGPVYNLDSSETRDLPETLPEVGNRYGIGGERVRQLQVEAEQGLYDVLQEKGYTPGSILGLWADDE